MGAALAFGGFAAEAEFDVLYFVGDADPAFFVGGEEGFKFLLLFEEGIIFGFDFEFFELA